MKPFDLQKAIDGAPVCYTIGDNSVVGKYMFTYRHPLGGDRHIFKFSELGHDVVLRCYLLNGVPVFLTLGDKHFVAPINMAPVKKQVWINVFNSSDGPRSGNNQYSSKEEAVRGVQNLRLPESYLTSSLVYEWEE